MPSATSSRKALGSRVSALRSTISARAVGSLNTRSGSRKVSTALRPFWPSASVANSITVTLSPAHGWLVRSRTKVSATFLVLPATGRSRRMHLGLLVVAQHVGAQHRAVQADLQLHAGHAEIVAGDVLDLGRPLVDADRPGELDGRREVGDDVQLPARLLVAARLQDDLLALGDDLLDLVLALADGGELGALAVDHQLAAACGRARRRRSPRACCRRARAGACRGRPCRDRSAACRYRPAARSTDWRRPAAAAGRPA